MDTDETRHLLKRKSGPKLDRTALAFFLMVIASEAWLIWDWSDGKRLWINVTYVVISPLVIYMLFNGWLQLTRPRLHAFLKYLVRAGRK